LAKQAALSGEQREGMADVAAMKKLARGMCVGMLGMLFTFGRGFAG